MSTFGTATPPSAYASRIGTWFVRILGVSLAVAAYLDGERWWTALFIWMGTTFTTGVLWHLFIVIPMQELEELEKDKRR